MKRMFIGLVLGTAMLGDLAQGQEFGQAPIDVPHLVGADLFIDLAQYAGKQVVITDAQVFGAGNDGAFMEAGRVIFKILPDGIDRETFRYFLKNCNGNREKCNVHLLVTPTGRKWSDWPELADVKIVK
jgi:hypothetical protein